MKARRSIVFYAWLGLAADFLLVAGVVAFVLTGAAYQRSAILLLSQRIQRLQLANLTLRSEFLNTQRALRGYQATGQARFLQTFYSGQAAFVLDLMTVRKLAWPGVLRGVTAQERAARAAFLSGGHAGIARRGTDRATGLYDRASASSDAFVRQNQLLQSHLDAYRTAFASAAQRTLGIGMVNTSVILSVGLVLPVVGFGFALRWTSAPLHGVTTTVRARALGDNAVRATVGGPAEVRELARSVNFLAEESDRLRSVRLAATRIYEHLHAPEIISEAVAALQDNLAVDVAWVGVIQGGKLTSTKGPPAGQGSQWGGLEAHSASAWIRDCFQQGPSRCYDNLHLGVPVGLPPPVQDLARDPKAASLLLIPFGAGQEPMGLLALVRNQGGRPWTEPEVEAVESLARDIGRALEHARLYESEERHVAELQSLDRAKTGFLASASHDLRTPLTSIIGNLEMLEDQAAGPLTLKQAKMLDAVSRNGRRLQNLIEDMLTISLIQLGAFTSSLCPVDLARLIPEQVDLVTPTMLAHGLAFEVNAPPEGLVVKGDGGQLGRVVMNLLTNAVKYTPHGGSVTCTAAAEDDDATLTVTDTGMGIPEDEQTSVGTPFFRASNAISNQIQGSGLGMSIVRTVVANHHGTVELKSAEGMGTRVTIRIPLLAAGHGRGARRTQGAVP